MEEVEPLAEQQEGELMHTGLRLSEMRLEQRLSINQPWLAPLHDLKVEFSFHYKKVRETWGRQSIITLCIGCLAFLTGSSDLASGELSGGGSIWHVGLDGIEAVEWQAFAMMVLSISVWALFLMRTLGEYPLMREKTLYLFIGLICVQGGIIMSLAGAPDFPFNSSLMNFVGLVIGIAVLVFLAFNTWQAVVQTRDLHVETQHSHPDPRKMEDARRDHSLQAWVVVLVGWSLLAIINGWFGAHSVAYRDPSGMGIFRFLYFISGSLLIWTLLHLLWFPQIMLGATGTEIESHRSREVSREMRGEESRDAGQRGNCPSCGGITPVTRLATGLLEVMCPSDECEGVGAPGERCEECSSVFPNRITCEGCGTSAPISDHLPDDEAW
jgi:hypothetical protein